MSTKYMYLFTFLSFIVFEGTLTPLDVRPYLTTTTTTRTTITTRTVCLFVQMMYAFLLAIRTHHPSPSKVSVIIRVGFPPLLTSKLFVVFKTLVEHKLRWGTRW